MRTSCASRQQWTSRSSQLERWRRSTRERVHLFGGPHRRAEREESPVEERTGEGSTYRCLGSPKVVVNEAKSCEGPLEERPGGCGVDP